MTGKNRSSDSVTGADVARAAEVSQSVVSLVFSGQPGSRVSKETQLRVREIAAELGYVPNTAAAWLRTGKVPIVGLAVPDVSQPYFADLFQSAERQARQQGHTVILITRDEGWLDRLVRMIRGGQLAGAIVYGPSQEEAAFLAAATLPIVACELYGEGLTTVGYDFRPGMEEAAELLRSFDHATVACLNTRNTHPTYTLRHQRFTEAFAARGGRIATVAESSAVDFDEACATASELLDGPRRFTAVMCDDDLLAPAVIRAAQDKGWRTPLDLSVLGVGDLDIARMFNPALTTVRLPSTDMANTAVDSVFTAIKRHQPCQTQLTTTLITRETVTTAPASVRPR